MSSAKYSETLIPNTTAADPVVSTQSVTQIGTTVACFFAVLSTTVSAPSPITMFRSVTGDRLDILLASTFTDKADREDLDAIARIRILGTYEDGWNEPTSVAPTRQTVEYAERFARNLFGLGEIVPPYISASGDGEINFYWKSAGFILDLGFRDGSSYSYYARLPSGQEIIEDKVALSDPLSKEIIDSIRKSA